MRSEEATNYVRKPIIDHITMRQFIMAAFKCDPNYGEELIQEGLHEEGYSEDYFENENQQAFLDAGHFYGLI